MSSGYATKQPRHFQLYKIERKKKGLYVCVLPTQQEREIPCHIDKQGEGRKKKGK